WHGLRSDRSACRHPAAAAPCCPYRAIGAPTSPLWTPLSRTDPPQPAGSCRPQRPRSVAREGRSTEAWSCRLASSASPQHESLFAPLVNPLSIPSDEKLL